MRLPSLAERISRETGEPVDADFDPHQLAGMFNHYRPHGSGLERLLSGEGVEGEVRSRLQRIFDASSASWKPEDWYFVIERHEPIDMERAVAIVKDHLEGLRQIAAHAENAEAVEALDWIEIVSARPADASKDENTESMLYECLADFLIDYEDEDDPVFLLREAVYSIANDCRLQAYVLWPGMKVPSKLRRAVEPNFEIWKFGIEIEFLDDGSALVLLPDP